MSSVCRRLVVGEGSRQGRAALGLVAKVDENPPKILVIFLQTMVEIFDVRLIQET